MAPRQPNVIMVVVDDLGWRDLGCTGSDFYETPHIDALAARGVRFSQAYAAAPNCSPTRASLLTGRAPARVGMTHQAGGHNVGRLCDVPSFRELPRQEFTLARALRSHGYQTWHVGKWHLGGRRSWPDRHGFEVNVGGCDLGHPPSHVSPYGIPTLDDGPEGEYLTDRLTDEAIGLIDRRDAERPFFLNLWHYAVHTPLQAPAELVEHFAEKARRLGRDPETDIEVGEPAPGWNTTDRRLIRRRRQGDPVYAAMIHVLDAAIGRLLDAVARAVLTEDTVVVFTSDNGGLHSGFAAATSNLPLAEGKGWLEEGGLRVPLVIDAPGQVRGGRVDETPVCSPDLYPTLLGLAGLPARPEQHVDGVDLTDHLRGKDPGATEDRPLFWHFPHYPEVGGTPASAVRLGRHKLIRSYEHERDVLHDLGADPGETEDLAGTWPHAAEALGWLLDEWLADVDARVPQPNPYPGGFEEYARGTVDA